MASNNAILTFLIIFVLATNAMATRNMPADSKAGLNDKKQPEWFHFDGSVLVPGMGRYMIPKDVHHVNPFTYNPITGTNTGNGVTLPGVPGAGGSSGDQSYVPGGDDTLVPNPGVEVPNPAGGVPAPSRP